MIKRSKELKQWEKVRCHVGKEKIVLGPCTSDDLRSSPRRILFCLSRYKFAARIIGEGKNVLEIGCGEGLGTLLLAEFARKVIAIDIDKKAIRDAQRSFTLEKVKFMNVDFLGAKIGKFDRAVCLDVIEHIYPENETLFFNSIVRNLREKCVCIIGTPNKTAEQYAARGSKIGHVNLHTWDSLKNTMELYFNQVFIFSANDEIVHTGFYPMAHYLIGVGVDKKEIK